MMKTKNPPTFRFLSKQHCVVELEGVYSVFETGICVCCCGTALVCGVRAVIELLELLVLLELFELQELLELLELPKLLELLELSPVAVTSVGASGVQVVTVTTGGADGEILSLYEGGAVYGGGSPANGKLIFLSRSLFESSILDSNAHILLFNSSLLV